MFVGLKVREHKILGVFVDGLSKHPVDSFKSIEEKMEVGNHNRTIGATVMNATSSRVYYTILLSFKYLLLIKKGSYCYSNRI